MVLRFTFTFATGEGETDTAFKNRPWKNCFFLSEEYSLQVGELNGRTRMQEALSVYSGCHSRMKEKKQQRLSQRPFWCETWPEEFLLSGKLGYDIAIEIPPIKTWYFPIGKGGFPYWKRLVWRKKPVFSRVNRVKFSGSNAESRRLNNGKCRECWWKIVWLRCFLSGRILGTCSNDSDCCFVVLLSFFLLASFLWLPKKCTRTKIHWRLG